MNDAASKVPAAHLWYVRRGTVINGPFPAGAIKRYLILGRIRPTDEVSRDRIDWQPVNVAPAFSATANAPPDPLAIARADERSGERRARAAGDDGGGERRRASDRRDGEAQAIIERRARRARVMASLAPHPERSAGPVLFTVLVAVIIAVGGYLWRPAPGAGKVDCARAASPHVDWTGCDLAGADLEAVDLAGASLHNARLPDARAMNARLGGADLAYADVSRARFGYADLAGADLRGVTARGADFAYANLAGADLSYADLRDAALGGADLNGARFDRALWIDGRTCAAESVGGCL